jgi:hypothetical protein
MEYLTYNIFVCRYFRYVLIPHKCVIGEPRFFPNWRDTGAGDSCMFTTEICLDWSLPHYEDCGWYLDCPKDACPSSEKTIRQINDAKIVDPRDTAILQAQIVQLKLREPEPKETKRRKRKHVPETKIPGQSEISQHEELLVLSNDLDKNPLGGESSKSGCDVLEFHYSSTYDAIHRAPTNILRKELFILKNFLTLSFARSTAVKNKSEGVDVGPPEWIQWRAFIENVSIIVLVFSLMFLLSFEFFLSYIVICCGISVQ